MDLETAGKKILEALALRGQISSMENEKIELGRRIDQASAGVDKANYAKGNAINTEQGLHRQYEVAVVVANNAKLELQKAEQGLKKAEDDIEAINSKLSKFDKVCYDILDADIQYAKDAKKKLEEEAVKLSASLVASKKDYETRQKELKASGFEVNITQETQPKVTHL